MPNDGQVAGEKNQQKVQDKEKFSSAAKGEEGGKTYWYLS